MKTRIVLIIIGFIMMLYSCGGNGSDTSSGEEESNVTPSFDLSDLVGNWIGNATNSYNTISLDVIVDSGGNVTGSGVSSTWSVNTEGTVAGSGSYSFVSGSSLIVAGASWSLQLDSEKINLSGQFDVAYSTLHNMTVNLTKKGSSLTPTAIITSPSDGSAVSGIVDIEVDAYDHNAITKVEFYIDESLKSTDTSSPYSYSWDTTQYSSGSYPIKVIAYDSANQTATDEITVNVSNAKWEFLAGGSLSSSPAVDSDGTIYIGCMDNKLYAINPDGTEKWEFLTNGWIESSPAIGSDGTIYVGSSLLGDKLYAINPDGTKKWEFSTGGNVESSPAIDLDGTIYIGSGYDDNKLYAINPDGTKKWEFVSDDRVESSPAIGLDGTIYVGTGGSSDKLYAINPDGTKKWEFLAGNDVKSSPAIGLDGTIYVGSWDKKLYAINPDGTKKWEFLTGYALSSSPAIGLDGTIYVGSWDKKLYAINPDGTKKWEFLTDDDVKSSPAIGSDGTIYVGSDDKRLYAINPDGTKKWEFLTGNYVRSSPAIGSDGIIYVGSNDDKLYALYGSGRLADSPWPMFHHDIKHTGRK